MELTVYGGWLRRRGGGYGGRPSAPSRAAGTGRWPSRPGRARVVVLVAYAVPALAAVGTSVLLSRALPAPRAVGEDATEWMLLIIVSAVVLVAVDRVSRRLLPLAALLELSLAFPDQAPRRLAVAWRAGSIRNLHARIETARRDGVASEPARAAGAILELVGALHAHDRRTRGHSERVRALTDLLADELHLGDEDRDRLRWSALLHDVGKIHVPQRILNKPGRPTSREWEAIHRHPEDGARLAAPLAPWLGEWADVIAQHHERWDGSGYPRGLQGHDISYGARIVGLVDAFEVMTATRSYKKPMGVADARRELIRCAGAQFDPALVRAFLGLSIGRLRWIAGPLSWLAQVPVAGWFPHAADGAVITGGQAALGAATATAAAVVVGAVGPSAPAVTPAAANPGLVVTPPAAVREPVTAPGALVTTIPAPTVGGTDASPSPAAGAGSSSTATGVVAQPVSTGNEVHVGSHRPVNAAAAPGLHRAGRHHALGQNQGRAGGGSNGQGVSHGQGDANGHGSGNGQAAGDGQGGRKGQGQGAH